MNAEPTTQNGKDNAKPAVLGIHYPKFDLPQAKLLLAFPLAKIHVIKVMLVL
jgi:hypothetical protein